MCAEAVPVRVRTQPAATATETAEAIAVRRWVRVPMWDMVGVLPCRVGVVRGAELFGTGGSKGGFTRRARAARYGGVASGEEEGTSKAANGRPAKRRAIK
ncbi:hypothetical protein Srubr_36560 [Streptomyces rubradiris]|uniref:Uncharacterized protein n=1 Tax=Streptomyces rubradiris TaxID=285531 RepID=A0ABQ3RD62_STRRR|nr:hypothetical protein GCM10018792_05480 [Streptomyces rubradiris]GHI53810.1 hypothetical protein Srubr_36560 [Streptomyces rubradiris]